MISFEMYGVTLRQKALDPWNPLREFCINDEYGHRKRDYPSVDAAIDWLLVTDKQHFLLVQEIVLPHGNVLYGFRVVFPNDADAALYRLLHPEASRDTKHYHPAADEVTLPTRTALRLDAKEQTTN